MDLKNEEMYKEAKEKTKLTELKVARVVVKNIDSMLKSNHQEGSIFTEAVDVKKTLVTQLINV